MGIIKEIISQVHLYYGEAVFLIAAIASYIYLMVKDKDVRRKFLYPVGLIIFCVINPVLYKFVFSKVIYWRLLWTFPDAIIIALVATKLLKSIKKVPCKLAFFAVCVAFVVCAGNNAYTNADYTIIENWYKIPSETKEVCDIILGIDDEPRCIMPEALYSDVRQYAGEIELLYGRNASGFISDIDYRLNVISVEMEKEVPDYEYILYNMKSNGYDWVITDSDNYINDRILDEYEYLLIACTQQHNLYYCDNISSADILGWQVTQYGRNDSGNGLMSCYTIEDGKGNLIIIDGGYAWSNDELKAVINSYDNHVNAWIITNYTKGRVGAFNDIMSSSQDIKVDVIYAADIDAENVEDDNELLLEFIDIVEEEQNISYLTRGDEVEICGLKMEVLNDMPLCFALYGNEENMLFCSDIDESTEQAIMNYYDGKYDIDYVQMAYHGRQWRLKEFYHNLEPQAVFFDLQGTFIENEKCDAGDIIAYFENRNAIVYDFTTTPNRIILK